MPSKKVSVRASLATFTLLSLSLFVGACSDSKEAPACTVMAPLECVEPAARFADVAPLFESRCATGACHSGVEDGPWPLKDYEDIADWQDLIRAEVVRCAMPPPDSGVHISDQEREAILAWLRCGALK